MNTEHHGDHPGDHGHRDGHQHGHDHGDHVGHSPEIFRNRCWLSLILSIPVVFFSPMFAEIIGYRTPDSPSPPGSRRCWAP